MILICDVQHGAPMQIVDMGETAIDEATWEEYLAEMRQQYTADKVCWPMPVPAHRCSRPLQYHLLEFNCNSFTNDCIGFLTGGSIPDFIKGRYMSL
jgi:hypothetical protein